MINVQLDKDKIEAIKSLGKNMKRSLLRIAMKGILILEKEAKIQALSLRKSRSAGYKLQSGKLSQSITHTNPVIKGDMIEVTIGSNKPYAKIQEYGGIIAAKNKKLTIPFPGKIYPPAHSFIRSGDTFIYRGVIFLRTHKIQSRSMVSDAIPIYALKSSVTIPPQYWITKAEKKATPRIMELFNNIGLQEGTK